MPLAKIKVLGSQVSTSKIGVFVGAKTDLIGGRNISVYYDGLCHLCSREISHYMKMKGAENIEFVDITDSLFDAVAVGLDPIQVHKSMHVRDRSGMIFTGVDAFICIWKELPALRFLVPLARSAPLYSILKIFYAIFAKIRPFLPRKSCESSPYCEKPTK